MYIYIYIHTHIHIPFWGDGDLSPRPWVDSPWFPWSPCRAWWEPRDSGPCGGRPALDGEVVGLMIVNGGLHGLYSSIYI